MHRIYRHSKHSRKNSSRQSGFALLMTVFVIAILSAVAIGILHVTTVDTQVAQNQVYLAQARMTAEAGLNDAVSQLRLDSTWDDGFSNKSFNGGTYSVEVTKDDIVSTGTSAEGHTCVVSATYAVSSSTPPHTVELGALRLNE